MAEIWDILDEDGNVTGRTVERGKPMAKGEYHLVVHVWITNNNGEFLIAQRTPNKSFPNMWECVGGSAVAGDDSITTALKETREEIGIILELENGQLFKRYKRHHYNSGDFVDIWLFKQEVDIADVVLRPNETCGAMWVSRDEINRMIDAGTFIGREIFTYINELLLVATSI